MWHNPNIVRSLFSAGVICQLAAGCAPRSIQTGVTENPPMQLPNEETTDSSPTTAPSQTEIQIEISTMPSDAPTATSVAPTATSLITTPSDGSVKESPGELGAGDGLTFEEHVKSVPPPPEHLAVSARGKGLLLTWQPPPPVTLPHDYNDQPEYYLVYRSTDTGHTFAQIAETSDLSFLDEDVASGETYYYTVQAVYATPYGAELRGDRANQVSAAAP